MITMSQLHSCDITDEQLPTSLNNLLQQHQDQDYWQATAPIRQQHRNFALDHLIYQNAYPNWQRTVSPAWIPSQDDIHNSNLYHWMQQYQLEDFHTAYQDSIQQRERFWQRVSQQLGILFQTKPSATCHMDKNDVESIQWFPGAKLNIVESCFQAPDTKIAIRYRDQAHGDQSITYGELNRLSNRIANSLVAQGFQAGDSIAIDMTMTIDAVAIYLGIIKAGCVVVSIADSFAPKEIAVRLDIANTKAIFCQADIARNQKALPLYQKVIDANAPMAIVQPTTSTPQPQLRQGDQLWQDFLVDDDQFNAIACQPSDTSNILFSSGTTGTPKAIPWSHTTPIKCAADAYFHHDIHPEDVLAWPTNLGWMMGPWLIYATFMNQATMALYGDAPTDSTFGQMVTDFHVTMLGLVPSIVKAWRSSGCMESLDWSNIRLFSSSGECSNPEDMLYLMFLAGYKPIIEYCGGTEIGGGYITSTVVQPNAPSLLTTPAMGSNMLLLDNEDGPGAEVALIPPAIGLSTQLLNRDHHKEYYADMAKGPNGETLRRHGDSIQPIGEQYRMNGRTDDTMNLGGIKTSSAEIERVLNTLPEILETAAIGISAKHGGPTQLVIIYVSKANDPLDLSQIKQTMQNQIKTKLNPLFKITKVVQCDALPKTASNKIIRKTLRQQYGES